MAGLRQYRAKRDFDATQEPRGGVVRRDGHTYVIQKHAARRLHYDLRLELDGVLKSWAVTRGPSLDPAEKRLAVEVEDHPIEYAGFEGTIPQGQYGGGTVIVWDCGSWTPEGDPHKALAKGHLDFLLDGKKLRGRWHLVRMRPRQGDKHNNWLLIKGHDEFAAAAGEADIVDREGASVLTGRLIDEVGDGDAVWDSDKGGVTTGREPAAISRAAVKSSGSRAGTVRPRTALTKQASGKASGRRADKNEDGADASRRNPSRSSHHVAGVRAGAARQGAINEAPLEAIEVARAKRKRGGDRRRKDRPENSAPEHRAYSTLDGAIRAPMPDFIPPCLASPAAQPPKDDRFVHEIKFDGYRLQAHINSGTARLYTRGGLDWTAKFGKELPAALARLAITNAVIDGELVVEAETGASDFSSLQAALSEGRTERFVFYAFDLLHADGWDLRAVALSGRKEALNQLLSGAPAGPLRYSEHFVDSGAVVLAHACRMGLEGIVSKLLASPYRSGRGTNWIKSKCSDRQEFVIGGYVPSTASASAIGSLVLGYHEGGKFVYAGRVGTGFPEATARDLFRKLDAIRIDSMPFSGQLAAAERRGVIWVKPDHVAEVEFRGWTDARVLRHASFLGLREDKEATEVVREDAHASAAKVSRSRAASFDVTLTHPDRIYWPDAGVTKQGLVEYYQQAWKWLDPHIVRRPLSLLRCPEGIGKECFFQKQPWRGMHASVTVLPNPGPGGDKLLVIEGLDGLVALVQGGVLEIHPWGSSVGNLDRPDRLIFDLDPGPDVPWSAMVSTATEVRERLRRDGLVSFVKTTGGKGLHVVAPFIPKADWDAVKSYAHAFAAAIGADNPALYAPTMAKRERAGRIFIDYLRNGMGATAVAPYSTRARPGAPVSTPLAWDELPAIRGDSFRVPGIVNRLAAQTADPWAKFFKIKQILPTS